MNIVLAHAPVAPNLGGGVWHNVTLSTRGLIIPLAAIGLMVLTVLVWAIFFRKPRKEYSNWSHALARAHHHSGRNGESSHAHHRRRRRRRREHRPRNPTLAETGGLPPLRSQPPSDPFR